MTAAPNAAMPRINLELSEAAAEAAKPDPRKPKIAGAIERAVDAFKETTEFVDRATKIADLVTKAAGWLGAEHLGGLLASVGLTI